MAHLLRRPLCSAVGAFSSSPLPRRCFSQSARLCAGAIQPQMMKPKVKAERSMRVITKEQTEVPLDVGLFPATFILPRFSHRPSIFREPRQHLKLLWRGFRFYLRDWVGCVVFKFAGPEPGWFGRSFKIARSKIVPTALALHKQMYTSFAEGDIAAVRKTCTDGLYETLRARIATRGKGETVHWELVKYNRRAKLVSDRVSRFPIEGAGARQSVVRIRSDQRLTRWRGDQMVEGSGKVKSVEEFVVIQKRYIGWKEEEWMVWGTTYETGIEDVENWQKDNLI
ncbi:hypothetical protein LHYA1_G002109 [Lachnellula hyalina]|uniref:Tim44-like domain-containing protein n=1 Tax=Lachnellula hyalina TaxID=1316788 RepID=A0A8H8U370_9HELO|nr:uncharacterized protein LHYA1_G002109 [Lachnellula hyalina]TVY28826.1 hypothetical protein LHYA1_G002109 [Lachnellula hyalina]